MAHLRIGSRGSQLALWQANYIADQLRAEGHAVHIEIIKTTGDKITDVALAKVGTKGMFTKEIEEAMLDYRIDLAVHSLKDLPTELAPVRDCCRPGTGRSARHVPVQQVFSNRRSAAWGAHWHEQLAASGATSFDAQRSRDHPLARQRRYAPAQAAVGRV